MTIKTQEKSQEEVKTSATGHKTIITGCRGHGHRQGHGTRDLDSAETATQLFLRMVTVKAAQELLRLAALVVFARCPGTGQAKRVAGQ